MPHEHSAQGCIVTRWVAAGDRVRRVEYSTEKVAPSDSGFVFSTGNEPVDEFTADQLELWCLDCLLGTHPEAGKGMDVARREGVAALKGDKWIAVR